MPNPVSASDRAAWRRILAALELAVLAHGTQVDKGGQRYIWHVFRVGFSLLPDVDACVLGILHDIPEDQPHYEAAAYELLAHDTELLKDLEALTHRTGDMARFGVDESYEEYLLRLAPRERARRVKLADLADNMLPWRNALAAERVGLPKVLNLRRRYAHAIEALRALPDQSLLTFPQKL